MFSVFRYLFNQSVRSRDVLKNRSSKVDFPYLLTKGQSPVVSKRLCTIQNRMVYVTLKKLCKTSSFLEKNRQPFSFSMGNISIMAYLQSLAVDSYFFCIFFDHNGLLSNYVGSNATNIFDNHIIVKF